MHLFYVPHLEHMSLANIAVSIYNSSKSLDFESESRHPVFLLSEKELEEVFKDKISQTHLPIPLQKRVMSLIRPISFEVEKWKMRHSKILDLNVDLRKFLCWKSEGTIDRHRTAIELIQKDILPISKSFVLACLYCLKELAESLWKRMSQLERRRLFHEYKRSPSLVKYYIATFQGMNIQLSIDSCHTVVAIRHLLALSTPQQQKLTLLMAFKLNLHDPDILRYCLSQLEETEQAKVFEYYSSEVLSCFLEWPWQHLFMDVANQMWNYITKFNFSTFLEHILTERISSGWSDFDYEHLLVQFWCQSPSSFKDYVKLDRNFDIKSLTLILNKYQLQLS